MKMLLINVIQTSIDYSIQEYRPGKGRNICLLRPKKHVSQLDSGARLQEQREYLSICIVPFRW